MDKGKIVSKFLRHSGMLFGIRQLSGSNNLRILMYHRVFDKGSDFPYYLDGVKKEAFDNQMKFLSEKFSVITLDKAVSCLKNCKKLPRNTAAITIDDGYSDCYNNIYPVLVKYSLPATIFLTSNHIDSRSLFWVDRVGYIFKKGKPLGPRYSNHLFENIEVGTHEERLNNLEPVIQKLKTVSERGKNEIIGDFERFFQVGEQELKVDYNLTWPQIREMGNNGISFGAHTVTHPILTRIPLEIAETEIRESKERIERETGKPIYGFCYPNGLETDFNDGIINILKKYGFKYAVTTIWGFNDVSSDPYRLKRIGPNADDNIDRFDCIVSGGFEIPNRFRSILKAWV